MIIWFILGWVVSFCISLSLLVWVWRIDYDLNRGDLIFFSFMSALPISILAAVVIFLINASVLNERYNPHKGAGFTYLEVEW
jgi:phosphoglycerol transferase MdoB-like AlkP superfamily enzyme